MLLSRNNNHLLALIKTADVPVHIVRGSQCGRMPIRRVT
jgi:hypothetical protein